MLYHHCIFNFALEYAIIKVQENQLRLKLNGLHQFLAYLDVNLLGDNTATINRNKETLIDASKEVCLDINVDKTKNTLLSRHQNCWSKLGHKNSKHIV
jgi:hypothetical protein